MGVPEGIYNCLFHAVLFSHGRDQDAGPASALPMVCPLGNNINTFLALLPSPKGTLKFCRSHVVSLEYFGYLSISLTRISVLVTFLPTRRVSPPPASFTLQIPTNCCIFV